MSTNELQQIRMVFQGLQTLYQTHLPKVDPALIDDLLIRELDNFMSTVLTVGDSFSNPVRILSSGSGLDPAIAASGNNVHVVWESGTQSQYARSTDKHTCS